ncbi:MAG: hypothetical protein KA365_04440 [Arenimonas sp.]|nr:hypothetical protein [Arenimonas sp.]MBP6309146.1 hypothetical protein [Arenimonas sp.]
MNESLSHFRSVCRNAFSFLVSDFGFHEAAISSTRFNPYIVEFSNNDISLRIVGEGYGAIATVEYTAQDGRPVPSVVLEPNWQPNAMRKKSKYARGPTESQDEQIQAAALLIRTRDLAILQRDYGRLTDAANRWQKIRSAYRSGA